MNLLYFKHYARYGSLYNVGGGSSSDASTKTDTATTNNVTTADKRVVASDNAAAISGDGNMMVKANTDSHAIAYDNHSTNISTDFGSISAALSSTTQTAGRAIDLGQFAVGGAIDSLRQQSAGNTQITSAVIDLAKSAGANALTNSRDVMGFAAKETSQNIGMISSVMDMAKTSGDAIAGAYKNSADSATGNRTVLLAGLAVVGAVGAALAFKKG